MIKTKSELKDYLETEEKIYNPGYKNTYQFYLTNFKLFLR